MVDIHYPCPMPSTAPSTHYCQNSYLAPLLSIEGPVIRSRNTSSASEQARKESKHPILPTDIRRGLQTPPADMNGVSVNPLLCPNFAGSQYKSVPASTWNGASRQGSVASIANSRCTNKNQQPQNIYHNRSRSYEHTSTETGGTRQSISKTQNGLDETSIVSYLQIPSSINDSKGSLAEFAAQVCGTDMVQTWGRVSRILTASRLPACSGLSPRSPYSTSKNARLHQSPSNRLSPKPFRQWGSANGSCQYCRPRRCLKMSSFWP